MDISNLTKVVKYEITDDGFIFYDENGNVPDPKTAYWDGVLNLYNYNGKSLEGLPNVVSGWLDLGSYQGKSLKGLSSMVEWLVLYDYKGNDYNNLPKEYGEICIKGNWYTKVEFDNFWKTEKLKKVLLD